MVASNGHLSMLDASVTAEDVYTGSMLLDITNHFIPI